MKECLTSIRQIMNNEKYEIALQLLESNRIESPEWYFLVGKCQCFTFDFKSGVENYIRSADMGSAEAAYHLGDIYEYGFVGDPDMSKALHYYEMAASQAYPASYYALYLLYRDGKGVDKDDEKSRELLSKAVKYGDKSAEAQMAAYLKIEGKTDADFSKAFELATSSYKKGCSRASSILGEMYSFGLGCEGNEDEAFFYSLRAALSGYEYSQGLLGNMYLFGEGTPVDKNRAHKWLKKATENESSSISTYMNLAMLYKESENSFYNMEESVRLFEKAKSMGEIAAGVSLGDIYREYYEDYKRAYEEYKQAYDLGNEDAGVQLGVCYLYGDGVQQNVERAYDLFEAASKKRNGRACYWLGMFWEKGWLGKVDLSIAKYFYENGIRYGYMLQEDIARVDNLLNA